MKHVLVTLFSMASLAGCASGPRLGFATTNARNAEIAWQAIHLLDTAQTVTIARSPECLYEKAPLARKVYGTRHPSVKRVVATNAAGAALHWAAGSWLDRETERSGKRDGDNYGLLYMARGAYYAVSFLGSGSAVIGNVRLGIKPLSKETCGE